MWCYNNSDIFVFDDHNVLECENNAEIVIFYENCVNFHCDNDGVIFEYNCDRFRRRALSKVETKSFEFTGTENNVGIHFQNLTRR